MTKIAAILLALLALLAWYRVMAPLPDGLAIMPDGQVSVHVHQHAGDYGQHGHRANH